MTLLLDAVDANTDGDAVNADGGAKTLYVWIPSGGTFGGGTVTIEATPDDVTWIVLTVDGSPAAFTSNVVRFIDRINIGGRIRATLTGATNPVDVSAQIM